MCFIRKSKQTVNSPQKIPSMVYYQAIFTLSFLLLYLFYFLFLPRMPGNSLLVEVSQYWKKKKSTVGRLIFSTLSLAVADIGMIFTAVDWTFHIYGQRGRIHHERRIERDCSTRKCPNTTLNPSMGMSWQCGRY